MTKIGIELYKALTKYTSTMNIEPIDIEKVMENTIWKLYKNEEGKRTTVPFHSGKILHPKTLKSILRDAALTIDEFKKSLK